MKKLLFLAATLTICLSAQGFDRRNHATVAYIAEQHLTPEAYATVTEILGGESMMYYSSWMDDFKPFEKFPSGKTWPHTFWVDKKLKPIMKDTSDGLGLIQDAIGKLSNYKDLDDSTRLACMKQLIHLTGDIHCPAHVKYKDGRDKKIGKFNIKTPKGTEIRFHTYWDGGLLNNKYPGGYMSFAYICDPLLRRYHTPADEEYMAQVQKGSLKDWGKDIATRTCVVYEIAPGEGAEITVQQEQDMAKLGKDQILRAGYRLAKILNDLFGAE